MRSTCDSQNNYEVARRLCAEAKDVQADILCLPECFHFIGASASETLAQAETLEGPSIKRYRELAKENTIWLSLGGFHERAQNAEDGTCSKVFNTHLLIDSAGDIIEAYRKIHLFDVAIPGGAILQESKTTERGNSVKCCPTPFGTLGLSTCYDLRFPELYQRLVEMGADILLVPSAFTIPTGRLHWEILLRSRAIETQCFVVAPAQVGTHNTKRASYGQSIIIEPLGSILAQAPKIDTSIDMSKPPEERTEEEAAELMGRSEPCLIYADLDFEAMRQAREKMPLAQHREQARGWQAAM